MKTGGYDCVEDAAGAVAGDPLGAAAICAGAPVADMAGIPMALPGPVPAGAVLPLGPAASILSVPVGMTPVPAVVPPIPAVVPPFPRWCRRFPRWCRRLLPWCRRFRVGAPVLGAPIPLGAGAAPLVGPVVGAPILDMAGLGGKGAPTGPAPAGEPVPGQPIIPGPDAG